MCGRYVITSTMEAVRRVFQVLDSLNLAPRYNVAPTQEVPVVREGREGRRLVQMRWGLIPAWARDASIGARMINARAESLSDRPAFRTAFRRRRCLVVADGFYEWRRAADGGRQPYFVTLSDGGPFGFAGLWDTWRDPQGPSVQSCTIITTSANALLCTLHDRMPVIVEPRDFELWLTGEDGNIAALQALLRPYAAERMTCYPVDRRVNSYTFDDPACLEKVEDSPRS